MVLCKFIAHLISVIIWLTFDCYCPPSRIICKEIGTCLTEPLSKQCYAEIRNMFKKNTEKLECAKYALRYLRKDAEFQNFGREYYLSFNNFLNWENIMPKKIFCITTGKDKQKPTTIKPKSHSLDLKEIPECTKALEKFPNSSKDALKYMFYDIDYREFLRSTYGRLYLDHMEENIQLKDGVKEPGYFCKKPPLFGTYSIS